jgi:hypothetical protein
MDLHFTARTKGYSKSVPVCLLYWNWEYIFLNN